MTTLIGLSLTPRPRAADGDGPPTDEGFVTVSAFSRDRVVFDSGAAVGRAEAQVPLSGSATAGRDVEARVVDEDDREVVGWTRVAEAGPDEAWSGALDVPLTAAWMRPEVRLAGGGTDPVRGARRFGVGHVIALWGEGALARTIDPAFDRTPGEALGVVQGQAAHWERVIGLRGRDATGTTGLLTPAAQKVGTLFEGKAPGETVELVGDEHLYEDVDFTDLQVVVRGGARATFVNCRFGESRAVVLGAAHRAKGLLNAYDDDTVLTLRRCDFAGRGDGNRGTGESVKTLPMLLFAPDTRTDRPGYGHAARLDVERCRTWGFGSDAWKVTRGEARLCYFDPPVCTDRMPETYQPGKTYDRGAIVTEGDVVSAFLWVCEEDGTTTSPDFTQNNGSPYRADGSGGNKGELIDGWRLINPHADILHVYNSRWPFRAFGLHINGDCREGSVAEPVPGVALIGVNNSVRVADGDNDHPLQLGPELVGCYLPRDERTSFAVQFNMPVNKAPDEVSDLERGRIRHCRKGGLAKQLVHPGPHRAVVEACTMLDGVSPIAIADEVVDVTADFFARNPRTEPPVSDEGRTVDGVVQVAWHDRATEGPGGVRVMALAREAASPDEGPHTPTARAVADALMTARPGERFLVLIHAQEGAGLRALVDDGDASRRWGDEAALHALVAENGGHVGVAVPLWPSDLDALGERAGEALLPLFSGRDVEGRSVTLPGRHDAGGVSIKADRWFGMLYDPARTRWAPMGASRAEAERPLRDARTHADGTPAEGLARAEAARRSWREALSGPGAVGVFGGEGFDPLTHLGGTLDVGTGLRSDLGHPDGDDPDGLMRFGRLVAHAALRTAGLTDWTPPVIDRCEWETTGAHVELWSSAGPITTTRRARGLTRPEGAAHWTEVVGFQVDGRPAALAQITPEGRVRLAHPDGFSRGSVVSFGEGGATGELDAQEDAGLWMDLPIVAVGAARLEGVPLAPLPDPTVLANTLEEGVGPPATYFTRRAGNDAQFRSPDRIGDGVAGVTVEMRARIGVQAGNGTRTLFEITGLRLKLDVESRANKRTLHVAARGSFADAHSPVGALPDRWTTIRLSVLQDTGGGQGRVHVTVDGVAVIDATFPTVEATFEASRNMHLLARGAPDMDVDLARVAIWTEARPDGTLPDRAPDKLIEGDAAAANADGWKAGADPFV